MPLPSVIDQIDQLFDELIRSPWTHPRRISGRVLRTEAAYFDVEIALGGHERGDVTIAVDGHKLVIGVRQRVRAGDKGSGAEATPVERTFALPEDSEVSSIETRFEGDVLRVRVWLHRTRR